MAWPQISGFVAGNRSPEGRLEMSTVAAVANSSPKARQPSLLMAKGSTGMTMNSPLGRGDASPKRQMRAPRRLQSEMDGEHSTCADCEVPWPCPRHVDFLADVPKDARKARIAYEFEPNCPEFVVAYRSWDRQTQKPIFPEVVFENVELVQSQQMRGRCAAAHKHRLVEDFDYHRVSGVCYYHRQIEEEEDHEKFRYARLVTLNYWYKMLAKRLCLAVLDTFSIATTVIFIFQLSRVFADGKDDSTDRHRHLHADEKDLDTWIEFHHRIFVPVVVTIVLLYFIALWCALRGALWEWDTFSSPKVGDLIVKCHWQDRSLAFSAMVLFNFFTVEKIVKDLPRFLHPWKGVQPYAAVKMENARAYMLGFKSRSLFEVEKHAGQLEVIAWLTINKTIQLVYKIYLVFEVNQDHLRTFSSSLEVSILANFFSAVFGLISWMHLLKHRKVMKQEVLRILATHGSSNATKRNAAQKLLALHFGQTYKDGKLVNISRSENRAKERVYFCEQGKCPTCGRQKTFVQDHNPLMQV